MFHLDTLSTLVAATLVLLLGRKLVQTVPFLKKYTIPEPVAGGLLVALALLALKKSMDIEIDFDMSLKDPLMLAFFATIGLNANLASLRAGGKVLGTFLTGVASRYVGFVVALMLIVLGLFPAVSGFVQHIPEPVLGGATLVMFGTIAASGVRIVSREPLNRRAILIIALSLAVGLGVSQQPLILQFAPDWLKNLLSSGIAAGGITAIVLNLIFPPEKA